MLTLNHFVGHIKIECDSAEMGQRVAKIELLIASVYR